ncbi:MAG: HAD family hydrolase, partial [Anaerolineae bacterium]|nr:HAD family hydrolase [Anaerolineae bacterium]
MPLTILLDMDDTLISNSMDEFIPAYLKLLSACVAPDSPKPVVETLISASMAMAHKDSPVNTLEETFDSQFYPKVGRSKTDLQPSINSFYRDYYPQLRSLTQSRPDAQTLVEELLKNKHQIVIATNPLFPATAISQRLDWAGFESIKSQFIDITSYENYHFSKPHPQYYAEILAQLGWPEFPAVMIGNSYKDDIIPSEKIGLPAF